MKELQEEVKKKEKDNQNAMSDILQEMGEP